jgi:hypothetical protein
MLDSALRYLARGWNVIPVTRDKRPLLPSWEEYQGRMATEKEVREWWGRWPTAGIAVLTGALSGVVVVDADDAEGLASVKPYLEVGTLTVVTGRGGRHYYFKHPGEEVPCAVRFLPGTDCRGDAGYVVVPPSLHRSGKRYRWKDTRAQIVNMPAELLALLRPGPRKKLEEEDWVKDIPDGERDRELTRRAGRLFRAGMAEGEVLQVLEVVNAAHCKPPLGAAQVRKIVCSIAGREAERRERKAAPEAFPAFTVLSQREMIRLHGQDETRWTVADWLPEASCGLIVAPPGEYKTWMLTALAYSVATGRPFLGKYGVTGRGPVLFIQQEDPWGMLQSRLARMFPQQEPKGRAKGPYELDGRFVGALDRLPVHWYTDRRLNFADKRVLAGMEQKIAEIRPRLVMIDPLYTAIDTRDYMAEGAQRMTALKLMRDAHACSFVVAHHTTVSGSTSEDRASIWGSQFLNAWLEFGWRMPAGSREGNTVIRHFKGCEDPKRLRLKFKITDFGFSVDVDESHAQLVAERVEELILKGGSVREIAQEAGCGKSTVQRIMKRMDEKEE